MAGAAADAGTKSTAAGTPSSESLTTSARIWKTPPPETEPNADSETLRFQEEEVSQTYKKPSRIRARRTHGFRKRMSTRGGRLVLKRRRAHRRKRLTTNR